MVLKRGENVGERYIKNTDEHEVLEIIVSGTRERALRPTRQGFDGHRILRDIMQQSSRGRRCLGDSSWELRAPGERTRPSSPFLRQQKTSSLVWFKKT